MRSFTLALVLAGTTFPTSASADAVALFIHETQFNPGETEAVADAMTAAVEAAGDTVVWLTDPEDIRSANQALEAGCPIECFEHFTRALGVQEVFAASVWRIDSGASIGMAYRAHNRRHSISSVIANFASETVLEGVRAAHRQLQRWDEGHAPVLRVVTDPPGAAVVARGQPLGMTPLEVPMPPGDITIMVSLTGHEPVTRTVTVPLEDEANVELLLERTSTTAELVTARRSVVPPIAMTAIGAVGAASVLAVALVPDRCETRDAAAACIERRVPNGAALGAYAAVSGVLLVGGLVWAVRVRNHNERSTTVSVGPGSIHVGGSF